MSQSRLRFKPSESSARAPWGTASPRWPPRADIDVMLVDAAPEALERGCTQIGKGLERLVAKGKLTAEDRDQALGRLTHRRRPRGPRAAPTSSSRRWSSGWRSSATVLAELDRALPAGARSSPPTPARSRSPSSPRATTRPEKVIGMHFMNPGAGDAARRGHPRPRHQPGDLRRRRGGLPARWARRRSRCTTPPASSPTAC